MFECPECSRKPYKTEQGLMRHMYNKHDWDKEQYIGWVLDTHKTVEPEEAAPKGEKVAKGTELGNKTIFDSGEKVSSASPGSDAPPALIPMSEQELQENLARLFTNDAALGQALDEMKAGFDQLLAELKTTREPGATPEWADRAGSQVEAKMPDIIDTVLGVLKGLVNQPSEGDLFNFDPEFREYVKNTLRETLEARKTIVLRAVEDIEKGRLYYREEEP